MIRVEITPYVDFDTAGEHGRGEVTHTKVRARIMIDSTFLGNWTVRDYGSGEHIAEAGVYVTWLKMMLSEGAAKYIERRKADRRKGA